MLCERGSKPLPYYLCALENGLFLGMSTLHSFIPSFIHPIIRNHSWNQICVGGQGGGGARVEPITRGFGWQIVKAQSSLKSEIGRRMAFSSTPRTDTVNISRVSGLGSAMPGPHAGIVPRAKDK